jgi:mRNA interferase MazF
MGRDLAERGVAVLLRAGRRHRRSPQREATMLIQQGDIYWAPLAGPHGPASGIVHPCVVIQDDVINHSRITTVVVCGLTTNLKRAAYPGNVLLEVGEANLPRQSVVVVSQVSAVEKVELGAFIGSLSRERVQQIFAGMRVQQALSGPREGG